MSFEKTLDPYDPNQSCPKCGHTMVTTSWWSDSSHPGCGLGDRLKTDHAGEHLERRCVRCGYRWEQRVPDPVEEAPLPLMTEVEHQAVELLAAFSRLLPEIVGDGPTRRHDFDELYHHVHILQRTIGSQAAARAYPDRYRLLGASIE